MQSLKLTPLTDEAGNALMDATFKALQAKRERRETLDPHEARLMYAIRDAEESSADFAVLTSEARTVKELVTLAMAANRLSLILGSAASAALRKADTL